MNTALGEQIDFCRMTRGSAGVLDLVASYGAAAVDFGRIARGVYETENGRVLQRATLVGGEAYEGAGGAERPAGDEQKPS